MTDLLLEGVGWLGAAVLLLAYGLVSTGRLSGDAPRFQLLNVAGAAGLLANGAYHGAWPSVVLNVVWGVIGAVTLRRLARRPHQPRPVGAPADG